MSWPATNPLLFEPLLLAALLAPLVLIVSLGQIAIRPLSIWTAIVAAAVMALGLHDAWRGRAPSYPADQTIWPHAPLVFALIAGLFIAHALVVDSVIERRLAPSYARHFDTAWKQGVQIAFTAAFVGVFWAVLFMGAALFKLVQLNFFQQLIEHRWFAIPATTLAMAASFHLTDVQPSLIRGARTMALTLFSWLLPLLVVILAGFLACLPFISLQTLWGTHFAARLLLGAAAMLVFLINTGYQDGDVEQTRSTIKRLAVSIGSLELAPIVALAGWALGLRVDQYGWTGERIFAAAATLIGACYALGYAFAVVRSQRWMQRLEMTNVATSWLVLATILFLFSPAGDPARLTVASQMARLQAGLVRPEKFDFLALKFDGARWGAEALARLRDNRDGADAAAIAERAQRAIATTSRWAAGQNPPNGYELTQQEKIARIDVFPPGKTFPADFFDWLSTQQDATMPTACFRAGMTRCVAYFFTPRPDAAEAILIYTGGAGLIFEKDAAGAWSQTGQLHGPVNCAPFRDALRGGDVKQEAHATPDMTIGGERFAVVAPWSEATKCRKR